MDGTKTFLLLLGAENKRTEGGVLGKLGLRMVQ